MNFNKLPYIWVFENLGFPDIDFVVGFLCDFQQFLLVSNILFPYKKRHKKHFYFQKLYINNKSTTKAHVPVDNKVTGLYTHTQSDYHRARKRLYRYHLGNSEDIQYFQALHTNI